MHNGPWAVGASGPDPDSDEMDTTDAPSLTTPVAGGTAPLSAGVADDTANAAADPIANVANLDGIQRVTRQVDEITDTANMSLLYADGKPRSPSVCSD